MFKGLSLQGLNRFKGKIDIWFDKAIEIMKELDEQKVDKVSGKGLSTNDFTNAYKQQLDNMGESSDGGFATMEELQALFKSVYTVKFWNGSVLLQSVTVEKGAAAVYTGTAPSRAGHIFLGWDKDISNIQSDLNVYAQFTASLNGGYIFVTFPMYLEGINTADSLSFIADCKFESLLGGGALGDTFNEMLSEEFNGFLRYLEFIPISPDTEDLAQALINGADRTADFETELNSTVLKILADTEINSDVPAEGVNIKLRGVHCSDSVKFGSTGAACLSADSFIMTGENYSMNTVIMGSLELYGEGAFRIEITGAPISGVCIGAIPPGEACEADKSYITELFRQSCQNPDAPVALLKLLK